MDNILSRLFEKRGIKDITELTKEEQVDFNNWKTILDKEEITIKDIVELCDNVTSSIEKQFKDLDVSNEKLAKLTLQHSIYKTFRDLVNAPRAERESLVEYLTSLLKWYILILINPTHTTGGNFHRVFVYFYMPVPKGTRFRVKTTKTGKKIRLAFKNNKVVEVKKLKKKKK